MTGQTSATSATLERAIPSSGEMIPVVGCGTWQTFDVDPSSEEIDGPKAVVSSMIRNGGRLIDSSPMYGRAEQVTGEILSRGTLRDQVFLATKIWTRGREEGVDQMERSFRLLQTRVIDLMQVHNLLDLETHLPTLQEWKAQGRIRYLGVTHYTDSAHGDLERAIRTGAFDFVQLNYSLVDRAAEKRLLPAAKDLGVAVLANRPFGEGSLVRSLGRTPLPAFAQELGCRSWPELALKYVVSNTSVTCAIPATSNPQHMTQNMLAASGEALTETQRNQIVGAIA
ncbi:aldo/keto reductase [Agrobacterium salinitolerans]